ncbi:hypothetical protein P7K49_007083 [Saguinus oedipus]|uniref:Uncharacterized protein n=1 Tax=Saguinus oedipus TaxID=9490 RepID=A0ABQ9W480_SAGOE|nr:hypothetical protein P7K49_007083 [Saguinus oedipus]
MTTKEENLQRTAQPPINESENDPCEVVGDNFKSGIHKLHSLIELGIKNNVSCHDGDDDITRNDSEYDSGDTDKIIAMKKKMLLSSSEDVDSASGLADSEGDKEYNAIMRNCLRVNLALTDLEQLAGSDPKIPNNDTKSDGTETTTQYKFDRSSKSPKTPTGLHRGQQCICPEEVVASLLEGEENTPRKQKPKENNLKPKFQAFKGPWKLGKKQKKGRRSWCITLENLNAHPENKLTHIIFGSDHDCETEKTSAQEQNHPEEEWVKESMSETLGKLFDSSDDEESDSEDDSNRFKIKPQFKSRAGQKLMDLVTLWH